MKIGYQNISAVSFPEKKFRTNTTELPERTTI
jgi:hypothetical protein